MNNRTVEIYPIYDYVLQDITACKYRIYEADCLMYNHTKDTWERCASNNSFSFNKRDIRNILSKLSKNYKIYKLPNRRTIWFNSMAYKLVPR